jgi:vancomycin resistance protein YoaR
VLIILSVIRMTTIRYFLLSLFFLLIAQPALGATDVVSTSNTGDSAENSISSITLTVDKYSESISKNTLASWMTSKSSFYFSPNLRSEFENTSYCPLNKIFCALTLTEIGRQHLVLSHQTSLDESAIKAYLDDLARKVDQAPTDAKFKIEDGKVVTFAEAQNGITLDVQKSLAIITSALDENASDNPAQTIDLPFDVKKPAVDYADANDMGITSLIGEGTSDFKGSPVNRIFNIKFAANRFNGVLIKPGEDFSFVSVLGEVDGDHGYKPELVIKQNVTELDFGGGICQVSTTAFRAAIYSGLEITARRNHAYPVSYYNPQGMDATVYVPKPDLRFINNTPNYILIQTKIEGTKLIFDFYGTDDGRKIVIDGPTITERQPDGSLKATFTQHVFDKNGNEFIKDVFNSAYDSPYKYPHPGGPVLTIKPANWSKDQWKAYQQTQKDIAKAAAKKP